MFNILSKIRATMEERKQDRFEREHLQLGNKEGILGNSIAEMKAQQA